MTKKTKILDERAFSRGVDDVLLLRPLRDALRRLFGVIRERMRAR